ncbi:MAG: RNA polymerase sigma factor RpoD/SigA, partial [Saprospiraceae bacterium]|nr:RNA polymerase sigma factor RpoD/SigA [Saprospiraceae bacterium]
QSMTKRESKSFEKYLNEVSKYDVLTADQELELFKQYRIGSEEAFDKLINHNLRFVISVAKKYQHCGMSLEDLVNEGNVGLIKAITKFDETKGFKFISYGVWWIRQTILQAIGEKSRQIRLPANQQSQQMKLFQTRDTLLQRYEREPTVEELAETAEMAQAAVQNVIKNSKRTTSLDAPLKEDEDAQLNQFMIDDSIPDPDSYLVETESLHIVIKDMLENLSAREAKIITMYFGIGQERGLSLEEIGDQFQVNRERIRQIKDQAIRKLRKAYLAKAAI